MGWSFPRLMGRLKSKGQLVILMLCWGLECGDGLYGG